MQPTPYAKNEGHAVVAVFCHQVSCSNLSEGNSNRQQYSHCMFSGQFSVQGNVSLQEKFIELIHLKY